MCLQDWQIARRATARNQTFGGDASLPADPLRLGVLVATQGTGSAIALFSGSSSAGVLLWSSNMDTGTPPWVVLTVKELGPFITGSLFVQNPGGLQLGITELLSTPALERLFQENL